MRSLGVYFDFVQTEITLPMTERAYAWMNCTDYRSSWKIHVTAVHQQMAFVDFVENRNTRWFMSFDDDAVISVRNLVSLVEWMEARWSPRKQRAAGGDCLVVAGDNIQGGAGFIASRRLMQRISRFSWLAFQNARHEDRAVSTMFRLCPSGRWNTRSWANPYFEGWPTEDTHRLLRTNLSGLETCPDPATLEMTGCGVKFRQLNRIASMHPVKDVANTTKVLETIESAPDNVTCWSLDCTFGRLCKWNETLGPNPAGHRLPEDPAGPRRGAA
jgi:hypothetical protein